MLIKTHEFLNCDLDSGNWSTWYCVGCLQVTERKKMFISRKGIQTESKERPKLLRKTLFSYNFKEMTAKLRTQRRYLLWNQKCERRRGT